MRKKLMIIGFLPILIILFIRCSDTTGTDGNNFSFKITVKDTDGNPVEGLSVGVANKINLPVDKMQPRSGTNIRFDVKEGTTAELTIYNLNNDLIESNVFDHGFHEFPLDSQFDSTAIGGTRVYKYVMQSEGFEHQKYMCQSKSPDYEQCIIGSTDLNGKFETDNRLLFPHLYNLPSMPAYDESPDDYLGEFSLSDTVEIILLDQNSGSYNIFEKIIGNNENSFDLIWEPDKNRTFEQNTKFSKIKQDKGTSHTVIWEVEGHPAAFEFTAYIDTRPGEILTETSTGSVYQGGFVMFNVGNFATQWTAGEIVVLENSSIQEPIDFEGFETGVLTDAGFDNYGLYPLIPCGIPVELTAFQATMQGEFAAISWTTESESDLSCFNLYRDELLIHTEGATNSAETTNYEFIDEYIEDGETYVYDLEAVHLDGTSMMIASTTLTIEIEQEPELPQATALYNNFPNPFK